VFAWLWIRMAQREPSSPAKFGVGLVLVGGGFAVLAVASMLSASGVKVAPYWLVATYLLHSWGELALSPVGLSAMTKLAPLRVAGLMMGVWYLATSAGNFIGGRLSSLYGSMPPTNLFGAIAAVGVAAGIVMFALTPPIKRLMGDVR
jgi:POT family proton-dependent oligopeptide transporter